MLVVLLVEMTFLIGKESRDVLMSLEFEALQLLENGHGTDDYVYVKTAIVTVSQSLGKNETEYLGRIET